MLKLAGQMLTTRGVAAFWLLWCLAFVLMLWAVSPGRTLQDALAAELLQGISPAAIAPHAPLYEWLLWAVQQLVGPGPLSYSSALQPDRLHRHSVHRALLHTVASARIRRLLLSLVLFFWFGW